MLKKSSMTLQNNGSMLYNLSSCSFCVTLDDGWRNSANSFRRCISPRVVSGPPPWWLPSPCCPDLDGSIFLMKLIPVGSVLKEKNLDHFSYKTQFSSYAKLNFGYTYQNICLNSRADNLNKKWNEMHNTAWKCNLTNLIGFFFKWPCRY